MNQRGIISQIVIVVVLIAGILAGLYLVTHPQIFKPKAGGGYIDWILPPAPDPDNCVKYQDGKKVTTCPKVKFNIYVPEEVSP